MNKSSQLGSISSSDLIDAKLEEHQMCGSKQCPGCGHKLEGKPVRIYNNLRTIFLFGFNQKRIVHTSGIILDVRIVLADDYFIWILIPILNKIRL